jgi:hypothetical protein
VHGPFSAGLQPVFDRNVNESENPKAHGVLQQPTRVSTVAQTRQQSNPAGFAEYNGKA